MALGHGNEAFRKGLFLMPPSLPLCVPRRLSLLTLCAPSEYHPVNCSLIVWYFLAFAGVPIFQVSCNGYEKYLTDCNLYPSYYCARPFIACSNKPLDKRVCRKENTIPCDRGVCFSNPSVPCVDGDGKVVPKGRSYCKHCPLNYYGDGVNCQGMSLWGIGGVGRGAAASIDRFYCDQTPQGFP